MGGAAKAAAVPVGRRDGARAHAASPVTLDKRQAARGPDSRRTVFRYLRQVRHLRSYNHDGRFYTDHDPSRFDRFGLLSLGDVHFSRDGPLSATVLRLLSESDDGWTDKELRSLLHIPVHPYLLSADRRGQARRERLAGIYVYVCLGLQGDRQLQARQTRIASAYALDTVIAIDVAQGV